MKRSRILSVNDKASGIDSNVSPDDLRADATAYTAERDTSGKIIRVRPPDVTVVDEVLPGPPGACPQCAAIPSGRPLRESEDKHHRLFHCENCGTDFAVNS